MISLSPQRAEALLEGGRGKRIVVLGDMILDDYLWGSVSRISPEAPVPVVRLDRESRRLGGACNVARNLAVLGAEVSVVGVVGDDGAGRDLADLLEEEGIDAGGLVVVPGRDTTRKTRVIAHHQQVVRVDRETDAPLDEEVLGEVVQGLRARVDGAAAVLVEDYEKGVVEPLVLDALREEADAAGVPFYVDPKGREPALYRGARCLTPNRAEVALLAQRRIDDEADLDEAARVLIRHCEAGSLLVTRGEQGMVLYEEGGGRHDVPALAREVYDVTGAGDTVVAVLALADEGEGSLLDAAALASCAAAVVVGRLGTVAPSPEEILESVRSMTP